MQKATKANGEQFN